MISRNANHILCSRGWELKHLKDTDQDSALCSCSKPLKYHSPNLQQKVLWLPKLKPEVFSSSGEFEIVKRLGEKGP